MAEKALDIDHEQMDFVQEQLSKGLNHIESASEYLSFVLSRHTDWNDEIKYQIEEAVAKLGFALATVCRWWDDPDPEE